MTSSDLSSDTFVTTALAGPARGPLLVVATVVAGLQAGTYFTWATGVTPRPGSTTAPSCTRCSR